MTDNVVQKVLLLEDEPIICRIITRTLGVCGLSVEVAPNGQIAKEKIESDQYDLFILDIRTPLINGMQLYEYLEQQHPELTKKVVFTTGDSLSTATKKFLDRVNRPFLFKPYTPEQIKNLITRNFNVELCIS
jgi:DNA-binding NtrC family response regulator